MCCVGKIENCSKLCFNGYIICNREYVAAKFMTREKSAFRINSTQLQVDCFNNLS